MKAFAFRLEQVMRWRETQVELQKSRVAETSAKLATIRVSIDAGNAALVTARIADDSTGAALEACGIFRQRMRARIRDLEAQAKVVERTLTLEMKKLVEADQKLKLIGNLKESELDAWQREFGRELGAFADEAFLTQFGRARYNNNSGRARSSGG